MNLFGISLFNSFDLALAGLGIGSTVPDAQPCFQVNALLHAKCVIKIVQRRRPP